MSYFVVFVTEADNSKKEQYFADHMKYLDDLREQGAIIANGKFVDGSLGLIIFRGESQAEVELIVSRSPFAIHGVREFKVHEWAAKWGTVS
ncbi:YciI family protein [Paenibacillus cymbidii]|uniref:YciI family protein n=1 Tax=Paenibacillus cymbidii TaxID=1639034 RepID=UPI001436B824|nr:YciI family protein [Paenibacillus cymbidii]